MGWSRCGQRQKVGKVAGIHFCSCRNSFLLVQVGFWLVAAQGAAHSMAVAASSAAAGSEDRGEPEVNPLALVPVPPPRAPRLRDGEHMMVVSENWLRLGLGTMSLRKPHMATRDKIVQLLLCPHSTLEMKFQCILETATRTPELWLEARKSLQIQQIATQKELERKRKRDEREQQQEAATMARDARHGQLRRQRVLRAVNTEEIENEAQSRFDSRQL